MKKKTLVFPAIDRGFVAPGSPPIDLPGSPHAVFPDCPQCGEVEGWQPEHAHWRCRSCGFRDSCCD